MYGAADRKKDMKSKCGFPKRESTETLKNFDSFIKTVTDGLSFPCSIFDRLPASMSSLLATCWIVIALFFLSIFKSIICIFYIIYKNNFKKFVIYTKSPCRACKALKIAMEAVSVRRILLPKEIG
jgi:hypothetical protein